MSDKVLKQLDNEARTIFNYSNYHYGFPRHTPCSRPAEQDAQI